MKLFNKPLYLTDGGLETTILFERDFEMRHFASSDLIINESGRTILRNYFKPYLALATKHNLPFVFESPSWRLNPDWAYRLGYTIQEMFALNTQSIEFVREIAVNYGSDESIVSGCIGPRGDGYIAGLQMTPDESCKYHMEQVRAFAHADADVATAMTITYAEEAMGIIEAARSFGLPVVISFTLETDGNLPSGESLESAIKRTEESTAGYATHYMINCAHPTHFMHLFDVQSAWQERIRGIRANASCKSHDELDNSTTLDKGNPEELGREYQQIIEKLPWLQVIGGCCGTDHTHLESISRHFTYVI